MVRQGEPASVLLAIMIAIAAVGTFVFVVVMERLQSVAQQISFAANSPADTSSWLTYENGQYGFTLRYPPDWEVSTDGLGSATPFISLGNPLSGMKTYVMQVFIENNPWLLSSGGYGHAFLETLPSGNFKPFVAMAGSYPAYGLSDIPEADRLAERIYVAHGTFALDFDFPAPEENPGVSLPVINNDTARAIINTLVFVK